MTHLITRENHMNTPFYIGNVLVPGRVILAPMAGVTDLPFRLLCKECGADLIYTEMVSAKGITYNNKNTKDLLRVEETERPVALQLFGEDPQVLAEAARRIEEYNFDILDINMGCPVPKVVCNGEGSALMKDPVRVGRIIEAVSSAISKPVTVKIRKGFAPEDHNAPEIAHIAQESGAAAVAVHGRTREQYYGGLADWDIVRQVKESVHIPVFGNGDIKTPEDAARIMEQTGCDAVMIGRAVRGNPWLLGRIGSFLENAEDPGLPTAEEVVRMIKKHADLQLQIKGEYTAVREMRKHIAWYTAGLPDSAKLRATVNEMDDLNEMKALVESTLLK